MCVVVVVGVFVLTEHDDQMRSRAAAPCPRVPMPTGPHLGDSSATTMEEEAAETWWASVFNHTLPSRRPITTALLIPLRLLWPQFHFTSNSEGAI